VEATLAFHEISIMDVWEVVRRWHAGEGIRKISRDLHYDRKTVQRYTRLASSIGLFPEAPLPPREEVLASLKGAESCRGRSREAQGVLEPYLAEITELINDRTLGIKPKNAFLVLRERHELIGKVSYTSFKRFVRTHQPTLKPDRSTCRIEVEPGREVQIDYCRIGMLYDTLEHRNRTLYAFIATLAHSRLKYVELTFKQDQKSFVSSHLRMFRFFGGVPERITIDNLKSGVIRPDLYEPTLNHSYREMAEHFGCFIDPARIKAPKDKGKVERDVQTVRQAVRIQILLNPDAGLAELDRLMRRWSTEDYGMKNHGTTHEKPYEVFLERERPALKVLPETDFDVAIWKQATVHPDHYIQFQNKAYSIPHAYLGKTVWVRATEHLLQVYYQHALIKTHLITKGYRHTDHQDFPENVRAALDTSTIHRVLIERAHRIGTGFGAMIRGLLEIHAYVNLRCALGLVDVAEACGEKTPVEEASRIMQQHHIKATPKNLRHVLERLSAERSTCRVIPLSDASREFIRDISYFIKSQEGTA
jgi:transposase